MYNSTAIFKTIVATETCLYVWVTYVISKFSLLLVGTCRYCVACWSWVVILTRKRRATAERARKRSFVRAASKSMHFAGRQFVCVDASLRVCVRTSACMSACLCDTVTYAAGCCRSSPAYQCIQTASQHSQTCLPYCLWSPL